MSGNRLRCNKKLAAAVTLALVSSIGAPAWAGGASDETVGKAQYGGGTGQSTVRVFHDMDNDPDRIMTGSSYKESTTIGLGISGYSAYHYLVLGNEDFPKNGLFVGRNSAGSTQGKWDNVMQQGADKYGGTYQQIVCVLPDGTKLNTVITAANCNQQGTFDAIVEVVNEYASRPEVAKAVMEAYYAGKQPDGSVDKKAVAEALGKILPKFYYADTSGNYEEGALVPIASIQMGNIDVQQTGANSKPPRPVDMNVKTYDSKNVATGSSWRPLDRQVTYGEDGYITGGKWSTHLRYQMLWGSDGVLHLEE